MSGKRGETTFYTITDDRFAPGTAALINSLRLHGHNERFVSPALRLLEMGRTPTHLAVVIRAILGFDHPQDAEAVELQETIRAEGERPALARYAGIEEDHPLVDLVLGHPDSTGV